MSERFPGGIISKTAPVPTGPYETGTAPGIWTLDQQAEFVKQGIWPIAGLTPNYIEDVFSTWLYTGNGSTQTITNGIDLAGEGGLVWFKRRDSGFPFQHELVDTVRGINSWLISNTTDAAQTLSDMSSFNSNGFSIDDDRGLANTSGALMASWTFRKQPKFFDVVTYTGTGSLQTISHNLGSEPGCIFYKCTSAASDWIVYHRSLYNSFPSADILKLNSTAAQTGVGNVISGVTSTNFSVGANTGSGSPNESGQTYVAYLFAHDAGGFGLSGEDNVISCGSFTTDGSGNATVNLGYEPQWVLFKTTGVTGSWGIKDSMRGIVVDPAPNETPTLYANVSNAESNDDTIQLTSTGFKTQLAPSKAYIYIAIRRGPMKVPESGTEVFDADFNTPRNTKITTGFVVDLGITKATNRGGSDDNFYFQDRLRGNPPSLWSNSTSSEQDYGGAVFNQYMDGWQQGVTNAIDTPIDYAFRRAPGFFDEVCDTGTGTTNIQNHNLQVKPELIIRKVRSTTQNWGVYYNFTSTSYSRMLLNTSAAASNNITTWDYGMGAEPTSTQFTVSTDNAALFNLAGATYVTYLFATCPGVSKVGSYTGTAATLQIDCGFTTGARFVLIKRTDSTGDWYVWDSARGIVAGNDPYLLLNSTAAEVTNTDYVDTYSAGFEITSTAPAAINASGGSYIFLAIS